MSFGTDKCKTLSVRNGKREIFGFELKDGDMIDPIDEREAYKYLVPQQTINVEHK